MRHKKSKFPNPNLREKLYDKFGVYVWMIEEQFIANEFGDTFDRRKIIIQLMNSDKKFTTYIHRGWDGYDEISIVSNILKDITVLKKYIIE